MTNMETPRSPSVQSFASADIVSIAFTSTPGSPAMSPVSDDAAARATHEATDVPAQSHRFYLDVRSVKLKLDDGTFYNVHRHFFEQHAPGFAEQHLCGETPDIIEVHDVSSTDFQRFLSIIYPSALGVCDIRTVDEWFSVLRLASKWFVTSLRDVAIREIEALRPPPIDAILIAREFGLGETWLVPAFVALCKSSEPLGFEDAEPLGFRTAIEIGRIRESHLRAGESYNVEAAVRASDVLLSPRTIDAGPRSAYQLTPAPSATIPASDLPPTPTVPPTPLAGHESGPASHLDQGYRSQLDGDDDLAYLAMLADERAQAQLLTTGTRLDENPKNLFALRIAKRLVTEKSSAAIRHRCWRQTWLKVEGYVSYGELNPGLVVDVRDGKEGAFIIGDPFDNRHTRRGMLNVHIYDTPDSDSTYSVAECTEDVKELLTREGFSWSQDPDDAACVRVVIPSPSRDWFVDGH